MMRIGIAFIILTNAAALNEEILQGRIVLDAPPDTDVTLNPEFDQILATYRGCLIRVLHSDGHAKLGSDERANDSQYFAYDMTRLTLHTIKKMDRTSTRDYYQVPLAAFCAADNNSTQWILTIRMSHKNIYAPIFDRNLYTFRLTRKTQIGTLIGTVRAKDMDEIIYNSRVTYKLMNPDASDQPVMPLFDVDMKTGEIRLITALTDVDKSIVSTPLRVEACNYGSPKKCHLTFVNMELVKVKSPNISTIVATDPRYLIVCWSQPTMDIDPDYYTVHIQMTSANATDQIHHITKTVRHQMTNTSGQCLAIANDQEVVLADNGTAATYVVNISTHMLDDENSSSSMITVVGQKILICNGTCFNDGTPVCELINDNSTRQFRNADQLYCICPKRYDGNQCQNEQTALCNVITLESQSHGIFKWDRTPIDSQVNARCPYGPDSKLVTRKCIWNTSANAAVWTSVLGLEKCWTTDQYKTATSIKEILENSAEIKSSQILDTLSMLEQSSQSIANDKSMANRMIDFLNATIAMDFQKMSDRQKMGSKIRAILTGYVENLPLAPGISSALKSDNVIATVAKMKSGITQANLDIGKEAKLSIPQCVVDHALLNIDEPRISAIWLRDDKIFSFDHPMQRPILIIAVQGLPDGQQLLEPINFSLAASSNSSREICVYWHENKSAWSKRGIRTLGIDQSNGLIQCETDHLTGFSILLDFNPSDKVEIHHQNMLNLLSWIGCGCSMTALILTIITYALFPCLHRDHAGKVLLNLCISMLLLNTIFLLSSTRPMLNYSYIICVCIGAFLHYFTLTTLMWMGVEAANMYQMLVQVFASTENLFMIKRCMIAWGVPFISVLVTLLINTDHYFDPHDDYCRLSSEYPFIQYGLYLCPACLILLINCIGFIFVLKVLTQIKASNSMAKSKVNNGQILKYSTLLAQVRGALSVMVLLGITWVLGAFAIGPVRLPFMYAFCLLNSLQGFIIFLVRCLGYDEARRAWSMFLRTGKRKQQRGKTAENRFSDSRSSSNQRKRANTASSDASNRPLTIRNGEKPKKIMNHDKNLVNFDTHDDTEIAFLPRRWKFIDEPSSPTVNSG